jgi:hypothetical protein
LGYAKWILFKPSNETGYTVVNEITPLTPVNIQV